MGWLDTDYGSTQALPSQYTVTMFVVDVSPSMGKERTLDLPPGPEGEPRTKKITNLEWSLQFVLLKIQEMVRPLVLVQIAICLLTRRST